MEQAVCDALLREALPQIDWQASSQMAEEGLLTSMDILVILSVIYRKTRIRIPANEMKKENFENPQGICALCSRYENRRK